MPDTKPITDLTVRQVALVLYESDAPTFVKRVQRLIISEQLTAKKLPGSTGAYLIRPADLRDYQQKQHRQSKEKPS
jgi:hypothetical protein